MNEIKKTKVCTKCKKLKYFVEFYKDKSKKDELQNRCKTCTKDYSIEHKKEICKRVQRYNLAQKERIDIYKKQYYIENKEEIKIKKRKYYEANKTKINNISKVYNEKNRDILSTKSKNYYTQHKEKIASKNKEYKNTSRGKAVKKNSEFNRRTKEKDGDVTTQQLLEFQNNAKVCYWCNKSLKNKKTHIDHYEPLSKGGLHTLSNLVVSCSKCNLTKNAKDPIQFANSVGKLL